MTILDNIIAHKRLEVTQNKTRRPIQELQQMPLFSRPTISLVKALESSDTGIIAEFKRQSPSRGVINGSADVVAVTRAYADNGAAGLSVLTDTHFFGGSNEDLIQARVNEIPILRKDFMVDEYQIVEARAIGADVILLIAAALSPEAVKRLAAFAKELQLEVLLEIHDASELGHICKECDVIGVNNRNLKTFTVDLQQSIDLLSRMPADRPRISESGISDTATIHRLQKAGFKGFLIGENFMKQEDPAIAFASFVHHLKTTSPLGDT